MSVNVTLNGVSYTLPTTGEVDWGSNLTAFLQAIAAGVLQKTGGTFTLTADIDFGAGFGLKAAYYKSRHASPSGAGILRLGNTESVGWRNAANGGNLELKPGSSDGLLNYNSVELVNLTAAQTLTNKTLTAPVISSCASLGVGVITFGTQASPANTTLNFLRPIYKAVTADTFEVFLRAPAAGKISGLYVEAFTGPATQGQTITVRKNGVAQTLTCLLAAGASETADASNSFTVAAGDRISVSIQGIAGITGGAGEVIASMKFTQA